MIIGTAGHIDHGKSSLVRHLTGIDPDRLKEEKARGITIDLGFAYWPRPDGAIIGFVDVPGHEGLVHNMLAGATGIDFVLLAVAADDGVMPQTREHLAIMDLLGLRHGLVALTKIDLVAADRLVDLTGEIAACIAGTGLAGAEILPVSTLTGSGMDDLISHLDAASAVKIGRADNGAFRLFVDRSFTLPGLGTVVTGTVVSGRIAVDDHVIVSPPGLEARVRSIHAQNRPVGEGVAGQRCALVLSGPGIRKETVRRGDVVIEPRLHAPTSRIDARIRLLPSETRPAGQWLPVRVHHGAAEVGGRIVVLNDKAIAPGETELCQLVLEAPIAAAVGDRVIVRDTSARRTIGGGTLLDLRAPERRRRTPQRRAELAVLAEPEPMACLTALLEGPKGWADLDAFGRDRALSATATADLATRLDLVPLLVAGQKPVMLPGAWNRLASAIALAVDQHHTARPDQSGLAIDVLRRHCEPRLPDAIFAAALQRLAAGGTLVIDRAAVHRPTHGARLSPQDAASWLRIRPMLGAAERFRPPRVRDLVDSVGRDAATVRRLLQLSARRGETEEIATDHFFLAATVAEMAGIARDLDAKAAGAGFSAAAFRDQLDNGRKVAIQILDFFDKRGFTIRRGDLRRINPHRQGMFDAGANQPNGS